MLSTADDWAITTYAGAVSYDLGGRFRWWLAPEPIMVIMMVVVYGSQELAVVKGRIV